MIAKQGSTKKKEIRRRDVWRAVAFDWPGQNVVPPVFWLWVAGWFAFAMIVSITANGFSWNAVVIFGFVISSLATWVTMTHFKTEQWIEMFQESRDE